MKNLSHIEKSAFRKGEYVGYCNGAQRIVRGGLGWQVAGLCSQTGNAIVASAVTLEGLNAKLAVLASPASTRFSFRDSVTA